MNTTKLAGLEPAAVFHYFEELCAIYLTEKMGKNLNASAVFEYVKENVYEPYQRKACP